MPIIKWEPFGEWERFFEEHPVFSLGFPGLGWDLAVDVYEEKGNIIAKMTLPGIDPDDLEISADEKALRISGKREEEKETKEKNYYSKEIRRGSFSRMVALPREIDSSDVVAEYADGVLMVTMPIARGREEKPAKVKVVKR